MSFESTGVQQSGVEPRTPRLASMKLDRMPDRGGAGGDFAPNIPGDFGAFPRKHT